MATNGWKDATDRILAAAERGMKKAVTVFEADTKALTHVYPKNGGTLRRSWTHDVVKTGDDIIGKVGTNVPYAKYEDKYHGNVSTALNDNYDKYMKIIANEISKG